MGKDKKSLRAIGIVWFTASMVLIAMGNPAGWGFLILWLTFLARSTEKGKEWSTRNPRRARVTLVALTVLALVVVAAPLIAVYLGGDNPPEALPRQ
jgi:asparagine N-glycosylation enzyme membrane subunit Stt3